MVQNKDIPGDSKVETKTKYNECVVVCEDTAKDVLSFTTGHNLQIHDISVVDLPEIMDTARHQSCLR